LCPITSLPVGAAALFGGKMKAKLDSRMLLVKLTRDEAQSFINSLVSDLDFVGGLRNSETPADAVAKWRRDRKTFVQRNYAAFLKFGYDKAHWERFRAKHDKLAALIERLLPLMESAA
jgi:hypothetical protein